jgi:hypothetical protein
LIGLGGVSEHIKNVIKKIQTPIENAMNKLANFIVEKGKSLLGKGKADDKGNKDKEGKSKNSEEGIITAADRKKHEAIADNIYEQLKPNKETSEGFNQYFESKRQQANKLEKRYSPLLKKGIKLTIGLEKIKQREKQIGLKLRVIIKPNTRDKEYKIFPKEGDLEEENPENTLLNELIEKALENLTDEFYQGKSDEE